jgi:tetratricopeptide (TPR) repeat protein
MNDLNKAIRCAQDALRVLPLEHVRRANHLINIGGRLRDRYNKIGDANDLERAITYAQEALKATPAEHPIRARSLSNIQGCYTDRYSRTGSMGDLEKAINYAQDALATLPAEHAKRFQGLGNLAKISRIKYLRTFREIDLEKTIEYALEALSATPVNHPARAGHLNTLGLSYGHRYDRTHNMDDLEKAASYARETLEVTPLDHPARSGYMNNIGVRIGDKYDRTSSMDDLKQTVAYLREATESTSVDHPNRATFLHNLAGRLRDRYDRTGNQEDHTGSIRALEEAVQSPSVPLRRILSGRILTRLLYRYGRWDEASHVVQKMLDILPHLCGRYLTRDDQQHALRQVSGLAAEACSLSLKLNRSHEALQRVEFGRVLILGYHMDAHSDLSELSLVDGQLAEKYDELRSQAFRTISLLEEPATRGNLLEQQDHAPRLLEDCERLIRDKPGFEHFLRPATVPDLMKAATGGLIVIVNSTEIGSDAIIVSVSAIEVVPLPNMSTQPPSVYESALNKHRTVETREYGRDIDNDLILQQDARLYSWLWTTCVKPILEKIAELTSGEEEANMKPRIWWIGTGAASSLPFHAAGIYDRAASEGLQSCLSRSISSYTPSIKSLIHARTVATKVSLSPTRKRTLVIATMPTTPGHSALAGASLEADVVRETVSQTWAVESRVHPTASQVLEKISSSDVVHFACHGSSDPLDPSQSHLLLQKNDVKDKTVDRLTVSALLEANTKAESWLAYLSACSTAEVRVKSLTDESLHLTSAFQMAGFAHVIGSLRPADDSICVQVAKHFYSFLIDKEDSTDQNRIVAEGLNYATLQVSKIHPNNPDMWAQFIHQGA